MNDKALKRLIRVPREFVFATFGVPDGEFEIAHGSAAVVLAAFLVWESKSVPVWDDRTDQGERPVFYVLTSRGKEPLTREQVLQASVWCPQPDPQEKSDAKTDT